MKPSGSAARVGRLLRFLGGHGETGYSLSELARAVGIDKSTCQAMLLALVEQGFVHRDDGHRTYALGPSALAVAAADGDRARLVRLARAELESLTADLDLETFATTTFAGSLLVLARVPRSALFGLSMRVGQTLPLRPPVGAVHLAWAPPAAVDVWLPAAGPTPASGFLADVTPETCADTAPAGEAERAAGAGGVSAGEVRADAFAAGVVPDPAWAVEPACRHRRVLDAVRARGYSVTADDALRWRLRDVVDQVADAPADPGPRRERDELLRTLAEREYEILDPDEAKSWPVGEICAPVFGRDGRVAVAVGLVAARTLDTAGRAAMVDRLLLASTRLTALTGGRPPD
ncbi:Putative transcription regulator protein [Frankia alni ACN14a]|uniref:Transcription regulator protein n=1 Tax=Frankia alni (strain DSM 45986 / CECT 9034 / ACN14a) TaxID=326424 RepID=Q0RSN6_FRAAA|nr:Putative transcription regulator protein [Frankia alni ACN14a]